MRQGYHRDLEALQTKLLTMSTWGHSTHGLSCEADVLQRRGRGRAGARARAPQGAAAGLCGHAPGGGHGPMAALREVLDLRDLAIYGSQPFTLEKMKMRKRQKLAMSDPQVSEGEVGSSR